VTQQAGPGVGTIVPPDTRHAVRAVTDGKAIVAEYPLPQMA
jgi:quercetin dioxygenase-like cupin family protein